MHKMGIIESMKVIFYEIGLIWEYMVFFPSL